MRATNWEFSNRALVFGLIFAVTFPLYSFDHQNATEALANFLGAKWRANPDAIARAILAIATLVLAVAALIRTWASSFLKAGVVYASEVKTASLVADGPYRWVRNPLYSANILLAMGMGMMMSRLGLVVAVIAMTIFCYRLTLREEAALLASQGAAYQAYLKELPRFVPSVTPGVAGSGRKPEWKQGLKAECWYWGFAISVAAFCITLRLSLFYVVLGATLLLFWIVLTMLERKSRRT